MNNEQSEHIDQQFREAAKNFQPSVSTEAWNKMETLLDDEFNKGPQGRVGWYWFALILLLSGGAGVYYYNKTKPQQIISANSSSQTKTLQQQTEAGQKLSGHEPSSNNTQAGDLVYTDKISDYNKASENNESKIVQSELATQTAERKVKGAEEVAIIDRESVAGNPIDQRNLRVNVKSNHQAKKASLAYASYIKVTTGSSQPGAPNKKAKRSNKIKNSTTVNGKPDTYIDNINNNRIDKSLSSRELLVPLLATSQTPVSPDQKKINPDEKKNAAPKPQVETFENPKNKIPGKLYFTGSVSSEANSVEHLALHNSNMVYGIGVGYNLSERVSIQTGFYTSHKKYHGGEEDYYFKAGSYYDTVNMKKIQADCIVYDLPLTIRYNFTETLRGRFYGVAGLSTYLMKKEMYDYTYSYPSVWPQSDKYSHHEFEGNKHIFSVLNLSAGYERKLSQMLSLQAEPYLKVPLAGIGNGKVHLYSAGLQVAIKFQPVKKARLSSR